MLKDPRGRQSEISLGVGWNSPGRQTEYLEGQWVYPVGLTARQVGGDYQIARCLGDRLPRRSFVERRSSPLRNAQQGPRKVRAADASATPGLAALEERAR